MTAPVIVDRDACRDFARSSKLEWLETNGAGAFAMGTAAGLNRRKYHGLLIAEVPPSPGRRLLVARVEEEAEVDGSSYALGTCQYPGAVAPRGFELLEEFRPEPCATWVYRAGAARIEKQVYLPEGRPAVVIRYRADCAVTLRVRPFLANRDYHALQRAWSEFQTPVRWFGAHTFVEDAHWYYNVEYLEELERGFDFREDLYTPGVCVLELAPGAWATLCASLDGIGSADPPLRKRDPFVIRHADGSPGIMAGYPWFTEWGRDTMVSVPGLLIAEGRLDLARAIIENWLKLRKQGLIPNRFPDNTSQPEYNTADATLWMFQAMRAYLEAGGDRAFLLDVFLPAAREIVEWHRRGTMYGIAVDARDGLLHAGSPATQLTDFA